MAEEDLTGDPEPEQALAQIAFQPYDPQKHGDATRRRIALCLLWILAGVLVAAFITMGISLSVAKCDKDCVERTTDVLMKLMGLVFTPVVALVGSAIGFYFGAHPTHTTPAAPEPPNQYPWAR